MTKLCKNCTHSKKTDIYWCINPVLGIRPDTGEQRQRTCILARSNESLGVCKPEGIYFEAKPINTNSFLYKLRKIFNLRQSS